MTASNMVVQDGHSMLQLCKWEPLNIHVDISKLVKVLISPTKGLLLFLSQQSEALLLPLVPDNKSHKETRSSRGNEKLVTAQDVEPCSSTAKQCLISGVESLAWAHGGDVYDRHEVSSFQEFLVVSNGHGIMVHAFCVPDMRSESANISPENGSMRGKWVDWGPAADPQEQDQFTAKSSSSVSVDEGNGSEMIYGKKHSYGKETKSSSSNGTPTEKKWLRSFLTESDTSASESSFSTIFPRKESFPCFAEIISFSIYGNMLMFLNFLSHKVPPSDKISQQREKNKVVPTMFHRDSSSLNAHVGSGTPDSPSSQNFSQCRCSQVFSSYSHRLIGLVLTCFDNELTNGDNRNAKNNCETLVVVARVYPWGIQWLCSINLTVSCEGLATIEPEWADFQFSDNFLVCLSTSGLIYIWNVEGGNVIVTFHASQRLDSELCSRSPQPHLCPEGVFPTPTFSSNEVKVGNVTNRRQSYVEGHLDGKRKFTRLIVSTYSTLLAVIDELGIIYISSVEEWITENDRSRKHVPWNDDPVLGVLSSWKVAGSEICKQKLQGSSGQYDMQFSDRAACIAPQKGHISFMQKKREGAHISRRHCNSSSALYVSSERTDSLLSSCCLQPAPLRRVFVPIDGYNQNNIICFSPFGITHLIQSSNNSRHTQETKLVHTCLHVTSIFDERNFEREKLPKVSLPFRNEYAFLSESIGCCFQGSLYLVTEDGLFIFLPSNSTSTSTFPVEPYWCERVGGSVQATEGPSRLQATEGPSRSWQVELLDKVILYEGSEAADRVVMQNGWDLKTARIRHLQLALHYMKFDDIERCLEMLAAVNLAEEGILKLLFASAYQISSKVGTDSEVASAVRFLSSAACFATKMIRKYGVSEYEKNIFMFTSDESSNASHRQEDLLKFKANNSRRLEEIAYFLEVIRNIQCRLIAKRGNLRHTVVDGTDIPDNVVDRERSQDESSLKMEENISLDSQEVHKVAKEFVTPSLELAPGHFSGDTSNTDELSLITLEKGMHSRKMISWENPRDMIVRWGSDKFDLVTVVRDALQADRLPLAVLQLHLQHLKEFTVSKDPQDTFEEVRAVGRAIAYDLFLKGESKLAIATLQRLGEDLEICLRQLLFGTVRRSIRTQVSEEMKRLGYLKSYELDQLERLSLLEELYPNSDFWKAYFCKLGKCGEADPILTPLKDFFLLKLDVYNGFSIKCGDIDGVIIGSWLDISENHAVPLDDKDVHHDGYWACAAVWSDAWDQKTVDRMVLDQALVMKIDVPWESQFHYFLTHNNFQEVLKLLDIIPTSVLSEGYLTVNLDGSNSNEELGPVCLYIPNIKILRFSVSNICSSWLKRLVEQELAKKFIFLKNYWESTTEILELLACSVLLCCEPDFSTSEPLNTVRAPTDVHLLEVNENLHQDTIDALHKLFICYCARHYLPNLLDIYLDHHKLVMDKDSLHLLLEAAGGCQWVEWLIFSRVKGCEYDASFSNARAISPGNVAQEINHNSLENDEILKTIDDMAEGGGEIAALATLMYAPLPIQKCLCYGSVNKQLDRSFQCTIENLRHGLQKFPTLWRILVSACFGQDAYDYPLSPRANNVLSKSAFADYLIWRESIFASAGGDTSLLQMLPCWFSKPVRRLVKHFLQGPPGWQALSPDIPIEESFRHRGIGFVLNGDDTTEFSAISWEAAVQRSMEELYSSFEENTFGIEHHLHRGRALAAFDHLLSSRISELNSMHDSRRVSEGSTRGQTSVQSDLQILLGPCTNNEKSLISSVMPLAIMHFEDVVLVASCAFLLELCGLSTNLLRLDVAVLQRISSYYRSMESNLPEHVSPKNSAIPVVPHEGDVTISLAQILADDSLREMNLNNYGQSDISRVETSHRPSRAFMTVLQHLEKASLPVIVEGNSCGSWLSSGVGDGLELRARQNTASQQWMLVTTFCRMHNLPLSTRYLALLAKDNDWVGFLAEAHIEKIPYDTVIRVAHKDFSDPRLKVHVLTVLKSMRSKKDISSSLTLREMDEDSPCSEYKGLIQAELFGIIAQCERQRKPGTALVVKARDLRWSLLALIASCFPDVSPLSCLTVWLEISAARETSLIKVNDNFSQIESNIKAAIQATNSLPVGSRALTVHYNRKNPKRRRLMNDTMSDTGRNSSCDIPDSSRFERIFITQETKKGDTDEGNDLQENCCSNVDDGLAKLSNMIAVLCEQNLFLPLLRAFELFLPSCSLLSFIRSLQAFSQMRLSEASTHLISFSAKIKGEMSNINQTKDEPIRTTWISPTAVRAADAVLSTCSSAYEKRCLLKLLADADFGDGGPAAAHFRRLFWKINLGEPVFQHGNSLFPENENLDDASLLMELEKNGRWEEARTWAKQLESSGSPQELSVHHVTEMQAEAMVMEWKEFLWDIPGERAAIWSHCQTLFVNYHFPPLKAGKFFLKHAEAVGKDVTSKELHEMLLLSLQWLSGLISQSIPVYPLHLLREIETRIWLLSVESEAQNEKEWDFSLPDLLENPVGGSNPNIIEQTASIIAKMDDHITAVMARPNEKSVTKEISKSHSHYLQDLDSNSPSSSGTISRAKRRTKTSQQVGQSLLDIEDQNTAVDVYFSHPRGTDGELYTSIQLQEGNINLASVFVGWEEKVQPADLERAVLSLLEFGQIPAAKQLQQKLSPEKKLPELLIVDAALEIASISSGGSNELSVNMLDQDILTVVDSNGVVSGKHTMDQLKVLESLSTKCSEGRGRGLCNRIIAVFKAAKVLCISFPEAFGKKPIELLQLLSLKAQDSLDEATLLVQTHVMPPARIANVLAESFLKGLLAAHRGGYIDSQKEEGPAPLLWRFSDFLKWAELCPLESEMGHALMRLVITSKEIPHACEVELLILSHHFYKSSSCLDGVDVLVTLAANRVESYVSEGDFSCLARLVIGVSNFHALDFILGILIENGQLELLLQKFSAVDTSTSTAAAITGFRMAILTSLKQFNPDDLDALAMVYNHFDMKHETAGLLESRSHLSLQQWYHRRHKDHLSEDLLESMHYLIEAAEVYATVDAGQKTHRACARASLVSLQIRIPDITWLDLSETNARRALVEQSHFQEALIVAEAYRLNQPSEWALVLWNQMFRPDLIEQFVAEFVAVLPLQPSMLLDIAKFHRAEVAARADQYRFSVWGSSAESMKHLGKSFLSLLKRTRDLRLKVQLATTATGFGDIIKACNKLLDKVPESAGPLVLRRGHGGAYLPIM